MEVHADLLAVLRCPESGATVIQDAESLVSTDPATRRRFRVIDGIPDMILDDSETLSEPDWIAIMEKHGLKPGAGGVTGG